MTETFLQNTFFIVFGLSVTLYAILDGFDLGVGMLHLFVKSDNHRRLFLNAIGPVWDGNEVWLVIVGGALFAGFPPIYASLFSGFYLLTMLLLVGLMMRAVAIEFRSKRASAKWRTFWDHIFSYASYLISFGVGTALGNLIEGVPVDASGNFLADIGMSFRPYPLLIGLLAVALFLMHGAIFLCMKLEGPLHEQLRGWVKKLVRLFALFFVLVTWMTIKNKTYMTDRLFAYPVLLILPIMALVALYLVNWFFKRKKDFFAFLASAFAIAMMFATYGVGTFPVIVRSSIDSMYNLTIYNSSSSKLTLTVLMTIVLIGVPLVLAYGTCIYRIFKGKVRLSDSSY